MTTDPKTESLIADVPVASLIARLKLELELRRPGERTVSILTHEAEAILTTLRTQEAEIKRLREALMFIFTEGDGYGPHNPPEHYAGTTGEGHAECREIARQALHPSPTKEPR